MGAVGRQSAKSDESGTQMVDASFVWPEADLVWGRESLRKEIANRK